MTNKTIVEKFAKELEGQLILPGDDAYDEGRRVWNGLYDKHPAGIVRCRKPSEVIAAVNFAREHKLVLSVRGGGHDYAGNSVCNDGLVIDLSLMNKVEVDPEKKTARVEGGATLGQFDAVAQEHGLATTTATVSSVGIGGSTLGGGSGYLLRKHGLTLDNLLSVEIITADGNLITAGKGENEDLFWAIRGGGGNFGVVTSFIFQLHNVGPKVLSFQAYFPYEHSKEILQFYREFMKSAPEEIQCYAFFLNTPPVEPFPEEYHGKTTCALIGCYAGNIKEGETAFKPLEEFGDPFVKVFQPVPYTEIQKSFDPGMPKGLRWYTKAHYLKELNDSTIDILQEFTDPLPGPFTTAYLEPMGGEVNKKDSSATAFPHREAAYSLHIFPGWENPEDDNQNIHWAKTFHKALEKETLGGVYVNLLSHDEKDRIKAAYGINYERMVRIKKKWDPENLFRMNQNIEPKN
ncbi:FAD-binding oxidoreductase [Salegentibacter sp. JZCK2]|uniref:FAD-binding oxidoreductase n=1 Tax=Salegentibacter tibetensis TaxID=2873600 RepID=UPI001CCA2C7F|nr:FAD-binding oxidoreductase [Salegentibacter tibetensis]MBZ9730034.1 FAD-binding oxidoreductase [Salegentibacter tibetensis]